MTLTARMLTDMMDQMRGLQSPPETRIVFTHHALQDSTERLFPASRNRSRRIEKKLIKRHGGIYRKQPCMWRVNDIIYAHPSYKPRFDVIRKAVSVAEPNEVGTRALFTSLLNTPSTTETAGGEG